MKKAVSEIKGKLRLANDIKTKGGPGDRKNMGDEDM